jgi:hypothetical protein
MVRYDDMIKIGVKRWRTKAMDIGERKKVCEEANVLQETYSHRKRMMREC